MDDEAKELEDLIRRGHDLDSNVPVNTGKSRKKSPRRPFSPQEHEDMLRRRRSDRVFMDFIDKTNEDKWKGDKVVRRSMATSTGSDESDHQQQRRRSNSESSLSGSEEHQRRLSRPQFFLNREDGSIVAAFETTSPASASRKSSAGKSYESLRLPFGKTEHYSSLEPIELQFVEDVSSSRAKSEPRRKRSSTPSSNAGTQTLTKTKTMVRNNSLSSQYYCANRFYFKPPRSKSSHGFAVSRNSNHPRRISEPQHAWETLQGLREQEDRHLQYRTTVELNSGQVRRTSTIFAPGEEHNSDSAPIPPPRQRHYSVTTLNVNNGGSRV